MKQSFEVTNWNGRKILRVCSVCYAEQKKIKTLVDYILNNKGHERTDGVCPYHTEKLRNDIRKLKMKGK